MKSNAFSLPWSNTEITKLRKSLLAWYDINQRDLPWRRTRDPYAIALSEVMLQQTQVKTVIPYYERWLTLFPNWKALANSPIEPVLKAWEGLGYYQRARNFKAAAHLVSEKYEGQLPPDWEVLQQLPGFGRYTAGAVASIAFSLPFPVVDGNVARVLARLLDCHEPINTPGMQKNLWTYATALVPKEKPGDFNQALMELGATLCTKGKPACLVCPLTTVCRTKTPHLLPRKLEKVKTTYLEENVILHIRKKSVWMIQHRNQRRWQGLWCFPNHNKHEGKPWKEFFYSITRYQIKLCAFLSSCHEKEGQWISFSQLLTLPMPAPHRKLANALLKELPHETKLLVSKART